MQVIVILAAVFLLRETATFEKMSVEYRSGIRTVAGTIDETTEVFEGDQSEKTGRTVRFWCDFDEGRHRFDITAKQGLQFREVYCAQCEHDGTYLRYIEYADGGQPYDVRFGEGEAARRYILSIRELGNVPAPLWQLTGIPRGGFIAAAKGSARPAESIPEDVRAVLSEQRNIDPDQCAMVEFDVSSNAAGRVVFDWSRGPSVVYADQTVHLDQEGAPDVVRERVAAHLETCDGFWFPSEVTFERHCDGELRYRNVVRLTECVINRDLGEAFTLAGMAVKPGSFVYHPDKARPGVWDGKQVTEYVAPSPAVAASQIDRTGQAAWILAVNAVVLTLAGLLLVWKHRKRAAS